MADESRDRVPGAGDEKAAPEVSAAVTALVDRLTPDAARTLYTRYAQSGSAQQARESAVIRHVLVEKLNASRRAHARRQFTELFEPFITPYRWLLQDAYGAPGVIHLLDVGGLWSVLAGRMLGPLSQMIDSTLAAMAAEEPLFLVLRSPKALALREELRTTALDKLVPQLADRAAAQALLTGINQWRQQEAARKQWPFIPRALGEEDLLLLRAVLEGGQFYTPLIAQHHRSSGGRRASGRFGGVIADLRALDVPLPPEQKARLELLVALNCLDKRRDYPAVVPFLLEEQTSARTLLPKAVNRHLAYVCATLTAILIRLAGAGEPSRRPLILGDQDREELESELGHLIDLLGILDEFGMLGGGPLAAVARGHLETMLNAVEKDFYAYLAARVPLAVQSRSLLAVDHVALVWMLGFITRWREALNQGLHWGMRFSDFRADLIRELNDTFHAIFAKGAGSSRDRIEQAARVCDLSLALGMDLKAGMTALDRGLVQTAHDRLADDTALTGEEADLLQAVQRMAVQELQRTRHWQDPALAAFVALAGRRLATPPSDSSA